MGRRFLFIFGIALIALVIMGVLFSVVGSRRGEVAVIPIEGMIIHPGHFIRQMEELRKESASQRLPTVLLTHVTVIQRMRRARRFIAAQAP